MTDRPDAPRLRAYFQYAERKPVLVMPREDWNRFQITRGELVPIDISQTPMGAVASNASLLAVVAQRFSSATAEVTVYRDDPKDAPKRVNSDKYLAWLDLPSHRSFSQMVQAASTSDNSNLRRFLSENVLLVKQNPGRDHRARELPADVRIALGKPSRGSGAA